MSQQQFQACCTAGATATLQILVRSKPHGEADSAVSSDFDWTSTKQRNSH